MKVKITKPDGDLFQGDASLLQLPGVDGKFEILNNHAPIISALTAGQVRMVDEEGNDQLFDIRGGVVKGEKNDILLLVQ